MAEGSAVERSTGRTREEWFALLDEWGAPGRPLREISDWLRDTHGMSKWWAQKVIVEYEQDRGIREPGVRPNGTFEVGASKTVNVSVSALFEAFIDPKSRNRWLTDGKMTLREARSHRAARFTWQEGGSLVTAQFESKGPRKAAVVVQHRSIPTAKEAGRAKEAWRNRLEELKTRLENA